MNIIKQASELFDEVVVAVLQNRSKKQGLFSLEERIQIIEQLYKEVDRVKVILGSGAAVDLAFQYGCEAIIRGIRGISDYDHEVQIAMTNKDISENRINTILLFADKEYQFVSSSTVKEVFELDKDISRYVEPTVKQKMLEKRG